MFLCAYFGSVQLGNEWAASTNMLMIGEQGNQNPKYSSIRTFYTYVFCVFSSPICVCKPPEQQNHPGFNCRPAGPQLGIIIHQSVWCVRITHTGKLQQKDSLRASLSCRMSELHLDAYLMCKLLVPLQVHQVRTYVSRMLSNLLDKSSWAHWCLLTSGRHWGRALSLLWLFKALSAGRGCSLRQYHYWHL